MEKMKVLVVGSGGREHALCWKLAQSPLVKQVYVAPGNPGMDIMAKLVPIGVEDIEGLVKFAKDENIGLVAVGPEAPLALGLADKLTEAGIKTFGPRAEAAMLETSKPFAKDFMSRHNIPTAAFKTFTTAAEAYNYLESKPDGPIVVKAAGLAQGKGVTVAKNRVEALASVKEMMEDDRFGDAGHEVVIEDFIEGEEVTILTFTDGKTIAAMPPVQDHKPIGEGDTGPNTGGMGAYSPVAVYTPEVAEQVEKTIIKPTLEGLKADGIDYCGCIYFGLILPSPNSHYKGPQIIEYNARLGDPETEVIVLLLKSDLAAIMLSCVDGTLDQQSIEWREEAAACVVIASGGYPGAYETGKIITENVPSLTGGVSMSFQCGTAVNDGGQIVTAGGRVITVAAKSTTLEKALSKVYERVEVTFFEGRQYRRDIAYREIARRKKM